MQRMAGFFDYPTEEPDAEHGLPGFLNDRGEDDWAMLLDHAETLLFRPGDTVLRAGERDRALYLLVDGWLRAPSGVIHPITTVGEGAFLDGAPRAVERRGDERRRGDAAQLRGASSRSRARNPALARHILLDLGRILSARLRAGDDAHARVDGLSFPNYTQIPSRLPLRWWQADPRRQHRRRARRRGAADRRPGHGPGGDVEGRHPAAAAAVPGRARASGATSARWPPPTRRRGRSGITRAQDRARVAEGVRLRDRLQPVHRLRRAAQARPRRQRPAERAAAAGRDDRRVHRRHAAEGQERLVLDDLPAAAGAAHLRPDAAADGRQRALPARASAASRTATTSTRAPPTSPTSTRATPTGAATASTSSARSRA